MSNLSPSELTANPNRSGKQRWKIAVSAVIGLVVIAAVFAFVFPQFADYNSAFAQIAKMPWWAAAALAVTSLVNILVYPTTAIAAIPHLRYRPAFNSRQVSFLISNVIPGGGPVAVASQFAVLAGYRVEKAKAVAAVSADAAWTYLITLGAPSLAVVLLIVDGRATTGLVTAAAIGLGIVIVSVIVITVTLRSDSGADRMGDILQKPVNGVFRLLRKPAPDIRHAVVDFHDHASGMVAQRWKQLTVTSLSAQMAPLLVLTAAVYGLNGDTTLTFVEVFAAYSIALLATMIPLTPGGLGTADAALVGLLTTFGAEPSLALAADLVWRLAWFLPQLAAGLTALALYGWDKRRMSTSPAAVNPDPA